MEKQAIFKGQFRDSWYTTDENGIYTVYLGKYTPDEILTSVNGKEYFILDADRLLPRKNSNGKTYYKILNK